MKINQAGRGLLEMEKQRGLHGTIEVTMDHNVSEEVLRQALTETLEVYPLVNCSLILKDNMAYYVQNDKPVVILNQKNGIVPGSEKLNGHFYYVNYYENRITVSISHAVTDGRGFLEFIKTLIYYYCCYYDQKSYDPDGVRINNGIKYEDDEANFFELPFEDMKDVKKETCEKQGFVIPAYKNKQQQPNVSMEIVVPSSDFMRIVKENGTNPSIMMFLLFSQVIYKCNPEEEQAVIGRITVDARKALGIPHTIMNCSLGTHFSVDRKMLEDETISDIAPRLKCSLKKQTSSEYLKQMVCDLIREKALLPDVKPTVSISYMGTVSFGDCGRHIQSFVMYEGECHKIDFYEFNEGFHFNLHFGNNTEEYGNAMIEILKGYGAQVEKSRLRRIDNEEA